MTNARPDGAHTDAPRVDTATRLIGAEPDAIYGAFADPRAMEQWLPPQGMRGEIRHFDFRPGGSYRLRLTYLDPDVQAGKTSQGVDDVESQIVALEPGRRIVQSVRFDSPDPAFAGEMIMTWTLDPIGSDTRVTVRAEGVPSGIRPDEHAEGLNSTLENLAAYVEHSRPAD